MVCEKCGAELPEGTAFCPKCGIEQKKIEIKRIHFDLSPTYNMPEPKKSKVPVFVITGLVLVLVAAVTILVASTFGQRNAKKVVEAAVQKTIQILQQEAEEGEAFGYFFEITSDYYKSSYTGDEITQVLEELGDFRLLFYGNLSEVDQELYGGIEAGMGDMKNIRLYYEVGEDGIYLALPDLYKKAFFVPQELFGDTTGTNMKAVYDQTERDEVLQSLESIFSDTSHELYEKAKCTKIGKEVLEEYESKEVICYEVTVSITDYQEYLKSLLERLKEDTIVMNWLMEISSKQMVEEFLDMLQEEIELYQTHAAKEADFIILSNIYMDKSGRMVQWKIPFEDENIEFIISFLGEVERIDDICINYSTDDGYCTQKITFHYQLWDENQFQSIAIDKNDSLEVVEQNQEELGTALVEILYQISEGGYLPSQYKETLDELLFYLSGYENNNFNYWEDNELYNSWEDELTYSENGNPILEDYLGNYQIELIAPPGTKLDFDWSYPETICFMEEEEKQDYYYEIKVMSDDVTDRFEYERMYLSEEEGYKNIVFSDIMQKEINGYLVYYQYCSYDYDFMTGYKTYYAWVRLDEEYVFELYLDDYTNSVEDDILDGCFQAVLPIK